MSKRTVVLVLAAVMVLVVFGVVRGQTYALDTPTLTATEIEGKVVLIWSEVEGATRYDVRVWDCVNKWQRLGEDDWQTTLAAHTDPADGITYLYTMQALNDRGEESDWAAISKSENGAYDFVRETVNPIPSPVFEVVAQDDHIQLHFSNVEEAAGYQARVWYPGAGNRWIWLPEENLDLDSRIFSYTDVQPGVDYFFVMRSYSEDKCGFSDWSTYELHTFAGGGTGGITGGGTTDGGTTDGGGGEATSTPTATRSPGGPGPGPGPGPANTATPTATGTATGTPTVTSTPTRHSGLVRIAWAGSTVSNHQYNSLIDDVDITVRWHPPDPPPDKYELQITTLTGSTEPFTQIREVSGSSSQEEILSAPRKFTYIFHIRGKNLNPDRYGPFGGSINVRGDRTFPDTPTPTATAISLPPAPGGLSAANRADGVYLDWSLPAPFSGHRLDEGAVYEHEIERRRGSNTWQNIGGTARRTSYTDTTAQPGVTYTYRVRARNKAGWGSYATVGHTYTPPTPIPPTATPTPSRDECAAHDQGTNVPFDYLACSAEQRWCARQYNGVLPQCLPPTPTPTATPDPCAGVTCTSTNCDTNDCCECEHCGSIQLKNVDMPLHLLLHEKLEYSEVVGVLQGVKWLEAQVENARRLRTHPYYVLSERHILREHHAQHDK